ncbi:MAG: prepilin-type N-terminal cleavage/methylation domain-containing protein [Planctomycetota bacterium]
MRKGFTLIELMIVIAIIAIIAAIAIPSLLENKITANESAAANSLSSGVYAGEVTYMGSAFNDLDEDNSGEAGYLGQMAGTASPYTASAVEVNQIDTAFEDDGDYTAATLESTTDTKSGYMFGMVIDIGGVADGSTVASAASDEIKNAENYWCCVAWPDEFGDSGRRTFIITNTKTVMTKAAQEALADGQAALEDCFDGDVANACTSSNRDPNWAPLAGN